MERALGLEIHASLALCQARCYCKRRLQALQPFYFMYALSNMEKW
jgi:hypothetical protein